MSNDDILEQSSQDESSSVDIVELLKAANSKVFDDQNNLIDTNKNFEKVSSFFDLIKSSNIEDGNLVEQDQGSEGSSEDVLDEEELAEDTALGKSLEDKKIDIENLESSENNLASENLQTEGNISEPEDENSENLEEEEVSSENFE
ncbi:MAG: hypothetical protein P8L15_08220, partial [Paracoccaceae bacterium]|nr:hypothetical protein [Paracoccaceae bacterium]